MHHITNVYKKNTTICSRNICLTLFFHVNNILKLKLNILNFELFISFYIKTCTFIYFFYNLFLDLN